MLLLYQFNLKKLLQTGFVDSKLNKLSILIFPDEFDAYIIVSFVNATLVLSIGDTVEEVTDSGFLGTTPTLCCSALGDDALVQVYPDGIRHIRADRRVNEWKAPNKKTIVKCAVNQRQVVIALSGGELVYFEMDPVSFSMKI
jgi:splicing factor 3B subunit 3